MIRTILAAGVAAAAGMAAAQEEPGAAAISATCMDWSNMPQVVCDCLGETAAEEFSPQGQRYLLALLAGDENAAAAEGLAISEKMAVAMFAGTAPMNCARKLSR